MLILKFFCADAVRKFVILFLFGMYVIYLANEKNKSSRSFLIISDTSDDCLLLVRLFVSLSPADAVTLWDNLDRISADIWASLP